MVVHHKGVGTTSSSGRSNIYKRALERYWHNMPIIEAKHGTMISVNEDDVKDAVPNDPECCAFSRACARMFKSTAVIFLRNVAYMDTLDPDGVRRVHRFSVSEPTRRAIERFDKTGKMPVGVAFRLNKVSKSKSLEYNRISHRGKDSKYPNGQNATDKKPGSKSFPPVEMRDGRGVIHFKDKLESAAKRTTPGLVKSDRA